MQHTQATSNHITNRTVSPHMSVASPRVNLQLRSHEILRRHILRSVTRVSVLVAADVGAFILLAAGIQLLRDQGVLGRTVQELLQSSLPFGYIGGWRFAAALFVGLLVAGNYGQGDRRRDSARLLLGVLIATALSLWQNLWVTGVPLVAIQFVATAGGFWVALIAMRRVIDVAVTKYRAGTDQAEKALFVGDPSDPRARQIHVQLVQQGGMVSLGWVTNGNGNPGAQRLSSVEDFWFILQNRPADTVVVIGHLPEKLFHSVVDAAAAAGCRTLMVPRYDAVGQLRAGLARHHGVQFIELTVPALMVHHVMLKRCIDILGSSIAMVLLGPLIAAIAVAIKLDSPGPVFFNQERVGLGGRLFRMLKFRTMRVGAEDQKDELAHLNHTGDPRLFKIPDDPRVTRVGAWLRRWSLDELPQFWNVFVGDMSLVGPRPFPESDLSGYQDHHFVRLSVKPGITGLWQVRGRSSVVDFEDVVRLDQEYIDRWSLLLDLKILVQTVPAVVRRTGAY